MSLSVRFDPSSTTNEQERSNQNVAHGVKGEPGHDPRRLSVAADATPDATAQRVTSTSSGGGAMRVWATVQ
jgi:hypothetical protein